MIELLVVLVVLAILAGIAAPLAEMAAVRSKETELRRALWEIRDALDRYKKAVEDGKISPRPTVSGYPPNLKALVEGVEVTTAKGSETLYFLRRIPRDPLSVTSGDQSQVPWGLRSYASPPDRPVPGDDVYDVYSMSDGIGLDGRPYREW